VNAERLLQNHPERGVSETERRFCKKLIKTQTAKYKAECQNLAIEAMTGIIRNCRKQYDSPADTATVLMNEIHDGGVPGIVMTYQE
jgi:hypothetical protein